MFKTNGYKVIDLEYALIDGEGITVKGIYEAIEGATKPILLAGVNANGTEINPALVAFGVSGQDLIASIVTTSTATSLSGYTVKVTDEDLVTVTGFTVGA